MAINTGIYVGEDNPDFRDQATFNDRWDRGRVAMIGVNTAKSPLIYHDFYNYKSGFGSTGRIKNFDGVDVFERLAALDSRLSKSHRLMLTFNVQYEYDDGQNASTDKETTPNGIRYGHRRAFYGGTQPGGYTFDEHVAMLGRRMREYTDAGGEFMRIRFMHEFMGRRKTDKDGGKSWCVFGQDHMYGTPPFNSDTSAEGWRYKDFIALWKRFVIILVGGTFASIESRMSNKGVENPNLNIDTAKLEAAGYDGLVASETLANNPIADPAIDPYALDVDGLAGTWAPVLTGNSEPERSSDPSHASNLENYFAYYYPGDEWVGYVGLTLFPKQTDTLTDPIFNELTNVYGNYSNDNAGHNKPFSISAYTRDIGPKVSGVNYKFSTPSPGHAYWSGCTDIAGSNITDGSVAATQFERVFQWAEARVGAAGDKMRDLVAFEAASAGRCEDGRLGARKENDGTEGYPNHMQKSRNHVNGSSGKYAFAT